MKMNLLTVAEKTSFRETGRIDEVGCLCAHSSESGRTWCAIAQEMLASEPALKVKFLQALESDAAFRQSSEARLEFFLRRHASWDERYNLYPVWRLKEGS